jgi:imidazolonepropionase-like amidohydrolase
MQNLGAWNILGRGGCGVDAGKGCHAVATRLIVTEGVKLKDLLSPESCKKMLETAKYHKKVYGLAIKKGVKCALGTNLGISMPGTSLSHGSAGAELLDAVEAGMTPLQAIEAATTNGPVT